MAEGSSTLPTCNMCIREVYQGMQFSVENVFGSQTDKKLAMEDPDFMSQSESAVVMIMTMFQVLFEDV